jgi:hypothetical protein
MRATVRAPRYAQTSRAYRSIRFAVPDFHALLLSSREATARDRRAVLSTLGLRPGSHLSTRVNQASAPPEALVPLARSRRAGATRPVEVVRSYGRGYVIPGVRLDIDGVAASGGLAVKGAGIEGWAVANQQWIARENAGRGLIPGRVAEENAAGDLWGEFWARTAGLTCPATVYCARRRNTYQHARLWRSPYRIWELTSGPFRTGPHITQAFVHLNWSVELAFAATYRKVIRARARQRLAALSSNGYEAAMRATARTVLDNVVRLTAADLQLSPFTLHLANIAYSGETTGFDRMKGPFAHPGTFRLGVLMTLIEAWAALAWLGAAAGGRPLRFDTFFRRFQEQLEASGARRATARLFLGGRRVERAFTDLGTCDFAVSRDRFLFARRHPDDIRRFIAACETFFDGLRDAFDGGFQAIRDLRRWQRRVKFSDVEETRIWQSKGGELGYAAFAALVREHRALDAHYCALLSARRGGRR